MKFRCPMYVGKGEAPIIEINFRRKYFNQRTKIWLPCKRCKSDCMRNRREKRELPLFGPNGLFKY